MHERCYYYLILVLGPVCFFSFSTYNALPESWKFYQKNMFEVAYSSTLFPRGGSWLVRGHIANTGTWVSCPPYVPTATESLKGSGFSLAEHLALATESSSLWWSEQLVGFLFLHSSHIPGQKCFHLAQQNPAKHIRN